MRCSGRSALDFLCTTVICALFSSKCIAIPEFAIYQLAASPALLQSLQEQYITLLQFLASHLSFHRKQSVCSSQGWGGAFDIQAYESSSMYLSFYESIITSNYMSAFSKVRALAGCGRELLRH